MDFREFRLPAAVIGVVVFELAACHGLKSKSGNGSPPPHATVRELSGPGLDVATCADARPQVLPRREASERWNLKLTADDESTPPSDIAQTNVTSLARLDPIRSEALRATLAEAYGKTRYVRGWSLSGDPDGEGVVSDCVLQRLLVRHDTGFAPDGSFFIDGDLYDRIDGADKAAAAIFMAAFTLEGDAQIARFFTALLASDDLGTMTKERYLELLSAMGLGFSVGGATLAADAVELAPDGTATRGTLIKPWRVVIGADEMTFGGGTVIDFWPTGAPKRGFVDAAPTVTLGAVPCKIRIETTLIPAGFDLDGRLTDAALAAADVQELCLPTLFGAVPITGHGPHLSVAFFPTGVAKQWFLMNTAGAPQDLLVADGKTAAFCDQSNVSFNPNGTVAVGRVCATAAAPINLIGSNGGYRTFDTPTEVRFDGDGRLLAHDGP